MAQRDLNFTPNVNEVVADKTTALDLPAEVAQIGATIADQSAQSKLLAQTAQAHVAFKQLDTEFRLKYADDPTNADGLKDLAEKRASIADDLGSNIPLLYGRQWQNKTIELGTQSDVSNELWAGNQQRINTVQNVNGAIKTYLDSANKDGATFGASDATDLSGAMNFLTSRAQIEQFGTPTLGAPKTGELLKSYNKDYVKSFLSGVAETSPAKATELINSPEINQHFTTEEKGDMIDQIARVQRQQKLQKQLTTTMNDTGLTDVVNDENTTYYEKRANIDRLELEGNISPTAASKARRVIKSTADLNSQTDTPVMAEIINQIYDLNANSASNASDYLHGVQNVQEKILEKQANGDLTAPDAGKLNKQLVTLTNKRISDATQQVGNEFYDANQKFNVLPPEYRGEATRQLFYATDGKSYTKEQSITQAQTIIDGINQKRRAQALTTVNNAAANDAKFLKSIKASPADITETARKHHITEAEVMRQLRMHTANKAARAAGVSQIGADAGAPAGPSEAAAPVVLTPMDGDGADTESTGEDLSE